MKVALFFAWFLGFAIGLPALALFLLKQGGGPAFVVDGRAAAIQDGRFADPAALFGPDAANVVADARASFPAADAAAAAVFADGTRAIALGALDGRKYGLLGAWYTTYKTGSTTQDSGGTRFDLTTGEVAWSAAQDGFHIVVIGPDRAAMAARRAAIPALRDNPDRGAGAKLEREYLPYTLAALAVWVLLTAYQFGRIASWAGATPAVSGVAPIAGADMEQRLLALNDLDAPYTITRGKAPGEFYVEWRIVDQKWLQPMRVAGRRKLHRLWLRLDPDDHRVRAMDQESSVDWSGGPGGMHLNWSTNYGIVFARIEVERGVGLLLDNGETRPALAYSYSFNLNELKQPIVGLITGNGWDYRPVITFWRPLGG